ncbi:MAG: DUF2264 domain-containing protein, partial [Acidobacteriaceae bacterium]|nr:DUF2264 domain-containing protein [Acidobacteriaceae bacterium]
VLSALSQRKLIAAMPVEAPHDNAPDRKKYTYLEALGLLAGMALRKELPDGVAPEQVRCALSAVIRRTIEAPGTFDDQGWLQVGFCGHQPAIAEPYISTGSLYLCSVAFAPLGLSSTDAFWSGPSKPWSAQKVWSGQDVPADHAI